MKRIFALLMVMIMAVTCIGCETTADTKEELQRFQKEYLTLFDTVTQLIGYADTEKVFETQAQLIYDELEVYHKLYDIYENYEGINNIKTINDNAGIAPVVVDRKIIDLLLLGKELYEETDGKINIAFGSVLSIWHTYRTEGLEHPEAATIPTEEELTEAANHTDITKVIIDEAASTVYLEDENMSLDVGSIGKGYAVEKAAQAAKEAGVTSMLFSVGGNIRAIGVKGNGESWKVGIQNPYEDVEGSYLKKVAARNVSLVTSGDYQRYYEVEGKRYHHIISPDTLFPAENFRAVSILCEDSGRADGLSTAVFNMTYEEGLAFIEGLSGVEAMWMLSDETIYYSSGFEKNLVE